MLRRVFHSEALERQLDALVKDLVKIEADIDSGEKTEMDRAAKL